MNRWVLVAIGIVLVALSCSSGTGGSSQAKNGLTTTAAKIGVDTATPSTATPDIGVGTATPSGPLILIEDSGLEASWTGLIHNVGSCLIGAFGPLPMDSEAVVLINGADNDVKLSDDGSVLIFNGILFQLGIDRLEFGGGVLPQPSTNTSLVPADCHHDAVWFIDNITLAQ